MAETRLADVIVPEVFTAYSLEPSIYRSRFFRSGAMSENAGISSLLAGGGETYTLPFWKDTAGSSGNIPSETAATTVNSVGTGSQKFRKQLRERAWGANDISSVFAGSDGVDAAASRVADYWAQAIDQIAIRTMEGVIADNIANDSGDLVNGNGAAALFSDDGVIDTQALLGENGTLTGDDVNGTYTTILVHPDTYALMRKQDVIDFVPISGQTRPLEFYMNMRVIVDRNATVNTVPATDEYDTYILKSNALSMGMTSSGYIPTEIERVENQGFGIDNLWTRRVLAVHPMGFAWQESSVAGVSPTDAELQAAANWNRVYEKESCGFVVYRHTLA